MTILTPIERSQLVRNLKVRTPEERGEELERWSENYNTTPHALAKQVADEVPDLQ